MLIAACALEPAPPYAVVPEHVVTAVLRELGESQRKRGQLDRAFRSLESEQPALSAFLAGELAELEAPASQALAYFLFLGICSAFRSAFGTRLPVVSELDIEGALDLLLADGEVRSQTCRAGSFSQDRIACLQPALMDAVMTELALANAALAQTDRGDPDALDTDPILQVVLVQVLALTRAVCPA